MEISGYPLNITKQQILQHMAWTHSSLYIEVLYLKLHESTYHMVVCNEDSADLIIDNFHESDWNGCELLVYRPEEHDEDIPVDPPEEDWATHEDNPPTYSSASPSPSASPILIPSITPPPVISKITPPPTTAISGGRPITWVLPRIRLGILEAVVEVLKACGLHESDYVMGMQDGTCFIPCYVMLRD